MRLLRKRLRGHGKRHDPLEQPQDGRGLSMTDTPNIPHEPATLRIKTREQKWVVLDAGITEMLLTREQALRLCNALKETALRVKS